MKNLTLKDIAEKAGVSTGTVSRILTRAASGITISGKTRRKVLKLVEELGYHPDIYARSLRTRRTYTVGVIIEDIEDPYFGPIIGGIEEVLIPQDYHFLITDAKDSGERESVCVDYFLSRRVEGIIFAGSPAGHSDEPIRKVVKRALPGVLLNRESRLHLPYVAGDDQRGGYLATKHLLKLGHKRIAFLSGPPAKLDSQNRLKGYSKALKECRIHFDERLVEGANHTLRSGCQAMKRLLRRCPEVTACFAYNDLLALGAIEALREERRRIPEDFSIVGFDDIPFAQYSNPRLTTVRQPVRELGRKSAEVLLEILSASKKKSLKTIMLEPELIIRKTTKSVKQPKNNRKQYTR